MICSTCRRSLLYRVSSQILEVTPRLTRSPLQPRFITTVPSTSNAAPTTPLPSTQTGNPIISSSTPGLSQPLSQPHSSLIDSTTSTVSKIKSSIPGGQELKGLGYLKATPTIMAKEDDQYPEWLWTLLEESAAGTGGNDANRVDVASMTKKQRAKYDRKQERMHKNLIKPIPIHEQSQNLTTEGDDAVTSLKKRQEITKSSREARRKGIRESNFLKSL